MKMLEITSENIKPIPNLVKVNDLIIKLSLFDQTEQPITSNITDDSSEYDNITDLLNS